MELRRGVFCGSVAIHTCGKLGGGNAGFGECEVGLLSHGISPDNPSYEKKRFCIFSMLMAHAGWERCLLSAIWIWWLHSSSIWCHGCPDESHLIESGIFPEKSVLACIFLSYSTDPSGGLLDRLREEDI